MNYAIIDKKTKETIYIFETRQEAEDWLTAKAEIRPWILDFLRVEEIQKPF